MGQDLSNYSDEYFSKNQAENWFMPHGLLRPDQLAALCYAFGWPFWGDEHYQQRQPDGIMSIGCGEGYLESVLERMGERVIGVDPSPGAEKLYRGRVLHKDVSAITECRTIIFCESLEHIPLEQILGIWKKAARETRFIVTNWPAYHPIPADSEWDHITEVNDALFARLSRWMYPIVRRGSHLVVDKP